MAAGGLYSARQSAPGPKSSEGSGNGQARPQPIIAAPEMYVT